jgi:Ca-activated chloride channel family protein
MNAHVKLDHTLLAVEREHEVHAMLELSAPALPDSESRPPLRLALVLDRSGSMQGDKLEVARRCAGWLVSQLRDRDELALVDFDDEVRLLAPLAPARGAGLARAIASIRAGGSTNLSGGWLKGLEQLRGATADAPRTILLLTDGLANVGVVDRETLVGLAGSAQREGVGTTTIGFGAGFDEELLTGMADAGGGRSHYAASPDAAPAIFADELEGLTRLAAQNVSVEIRPHAPVELVTVLNDYPAVAVPGGVQLSLGDAYAGARRRVVLALRIPHVAALGVRPVADLVVRYVSVGDAIEQHELTIPVAVNLVSAGEAAAAAPDLEVREEVLVLKAARARDEAIRLADAGDVHAAAARLDRVCAELQPVLPEEAAALADLRPLLARYDAPSRKRFHYESYERKRRRRP